MPVERHGAITRALKPRSEATSRRRARSRGMRRDETGQMMLLTAFVLVIGFVALSAMVARVSQLPEDTRQSTDRPIFTESEAVARGVQEMMERIDQLTAVGEGDMGTYPAAYLDRVTDATAHFERLESARGFRLRFADPPVVCSVEDIAGDAYGARTVFRAVFTLNDVETRIEFTATYAIEPADPADPMDPPVLYTSC